jgi:hypothetical protein
MNAYVYIKSEPSLYTVGFYDPDGKWIPESDYPDDQIAAARVNYLNGVSKPAFQRLEAWMREITDLLCYQPEVPTAHKTELANALHQFLREIGSE